MRRCASTPLTEWLPVAYRLLLVLLRPWSDSNATRVPKVAALASVWLPTTEGWSGYSSRPPTSNSMRTSLVGPAHQVLYARTSRLSWLPDRRPARPMNCRRWVLCPSRFSKPVPEAKLPQNILVRLVDPRADLDGISLSPFGTIFNSLLVALKCDTISGQIAILVILVSVCKQCRCSAQKNIRST